MSSRPPPPHSQSTPPVLSSSPLTLPIHPGRAAPFPLSMAETQAAHFNPYALPATSGPAHSYARNPQPPAPVQLTELSIPPYPPRLQQQIQSSRPPLIPGSRPTPVSARYDRWPSVPLERILTDQPYASPPSGSATSQYGVTTSPTNSWTDQSTIRKAGERPLGESTPIILNRPVSLLAPELLARQPEQPFPSPDYTPRRGSVNSARGSGSVSTGLPPSLQPLPIFGSQNTSIKDPSGRFEIIVRQQPLAARACGFGERDRRVIDPPPIVQLKVRKSSGAEADAADLRYPFSIVHCTLWNSAGTADETSLVQTDRRTTRRLMGTLVASPFMGLDEKDEEGCFFCFPDLSCRTHGSYRLRFVFTRLALGELQPGATTSIITSTMSDVFTVFTAKDFPGMRASTPLTVALKRQGCAISVKKGSEKSNANSRKADSDDEYLARQGTMAKRRRR